MASISGTTNDTLVYDDRGNTVALNATNLIFDQKNQLTEVQGFASYAYDAAGRRVMKTSANGTSTYYFYSQAGQLMYQYQPTSNLATSFIYLGGKLIAKRSVVLVLPDPPASIVVPASSGGNFTVVWASSASAVSYTLEQSFNDGSWVQIYAGESVSRPVHLSVSGSYRYRVKACNIIGCSDYRTSSAVTVTIPPSTAPTISLPATTSTGNYTVNWSGVSGATSYLLQQQSNGGAWTTLQSSSATSLAISGKGNGNYGYRVQAVNAGGAGPWSTTATIAVGLIPGTPAAPHLSVSGPEWKPVFTLSWSAMPWATSYEVEQVDADGVNALYNGPATTTNALVLDEGEVSFRVRACSVYGCSAWSGYTSHGGAGPIPTPTLTVPASSSTGSYTVSWNGVTSIVRYMLQERINGGAWVTVQDGSATSKAISGKTSGDYGYQVRACNANRCGAWSATKTVSVGVIPAAPPAPHVSASGPNYKPTVTVSWAAVSGATSYNVEEIEPGASEGEVFYAGANRSISTIIFATGTVKFRVQACNGVGCSAWSGYGSVALQSGD